MPIKPTKRPRPINTTRKTKWEDGSWVISRTGWGGGALISQGGYDGTSLKKHVPKTIVKRRRKTGFSVPAKKTGEDKRPK